MQFLNPLAYLRKSGKAIENFRCALRPNMRGVFRYPPGHFYSPLLDIDGLDHGNDCLAFDGVEWWENIDLRTDHQQRYFAEMISRFPPYEFPERKSEDFRYFYGNRMFCVSDAITLSGIVRKERPKRIVEVGSGYSSAVMLDTLDRIKQPIELTFIEPYSDRLRALLSTGDYKHAKVIERSVQEVPLEVFRELEENDILFIDSSHVAKVGSDLSFLFLRVLPQLKKGVFVQIHDMFYPFSYPMHWLKQGRAWNESIFLRAFLIGNTAFQILAFNHYASKTFPDIFRTSAPSFLTDPGGSLWLLKVE